MAASITASLPSIPFSPHLSKEKSPLLDRIKQVAGTALALVGLGILFSATLALGGYFAGLLIFPLESIHSFFVTGIACTLAGFHLAKTPSSPLSPELNTGLLTFGL